MTIEAILLDFGGTLDTGGDHWYRVMADAYGDRGLTLSQQAYITGERAAAAAVRPGMGLADTLAAKVRAQGCPEPRAVTDALVARATASAAASARELARLAAAVPLALVSNYYGNLERVVSELGLRRYFTAVVDSAVAGVRKPSAAIFRIALDGLGVDPRRAAMVGDSVANDLIPAASLGCHTALVVGRPWPGKTAPADFRPDMAGSLTEIADALLTYVNS